MHLERYSIVGLLVSTLFLWPFELHHPVWVACLVLLAAWWVVPLGLRLYLDAEVPLQHWVAAAGLSAAFVLPAGWMSGLLAIPWLLWSMWTFAKHLQIKKTPFFTVALLFWVVAAAWAMAHALGWRPLDFSPIIVLLTAAHFHYAGFALMLLIAFAYRAQPSIFLKVLGYFTVLSTVLVAVAITVSRLTDWLIGEAVSGTMMALAGASLAFYHGWKAGGQYPLTAWCWRVGGILLLMGMGLAAWYALRSVLPSPVFSIPEMYAWHGSMNTLALLLLLLGWRWKIVKSPIKPIPSA